MDRKDLPYAIGDMYVTDDNHHLFLEDNPSIPQELLTLIVDNHIARIHSEFEPQQHEEGIILAHYHIAPELYNAFLSQLADMKRNYIRVSGQMACKRIEMMQEMQHSDDFERQLLMIEHEKSLDEHHNLVSPTLAHVLKLHLPEL
jgi:hypothetical protein